MIARCAGTATLISELGLISGEQKKKREQAIAHSRFEKTGAPDGA
jgi:hypothetical protein